MSDIEDMDMNLDEITSPTPSQDSLITESTTATAGEGKIKKKPGRKPNPASPQLRKIQNRAAQRAFRERREKHIKELEVDYKKIKIERDAFYKENKQLSKDNDILKCENWYLKGIVLSLQLVCYKHKLHIPKHTPHIDERALLMMAETAPQGVAAYLNVNNRNKSPSVRKKQGDAPGFVFTDQGVETVMDNDNDNNNNNNNDSDNDNDDDGEDDSMIDRYSVTSNRSTSEISNNTEITFSNKKNDHSYTIASNIDFDNEMLQPVLLTQNTTKNNMRAIQALRLRLRLQNALMREKITPYRIEPSLLQLTVPHDPRIDLLPTAHMRDRMILFRDQFDLDDCLRLLVNEAVFHGGDPSQAINWELPPVFFEKYWFLTTNYTLERTSQKWREFKNKITDENLPASMSSPPPTTTTTIEDDSNKQQNLNNQININGKNTLEQQQQQQHSLYLNTSEPSSSNNDNTNNNNKNTLHTMTPFEASSDHHILQESMNNNSNNNNNNKNKVYNVQPPSQLPLDNINNAVPESLIATNSSNYFDLNNQVESTSSNVNSLPYSSEYPMSAQRFMQTNNQPYMQYMEQPQQQQPQQQQPQQQQPQQQQPQQQSQQQQQQQQQQPTQQQQNWNSLYYFDFLGE